MSESLAVAIAAYAVGVSGYSAVRAALGRSLSQGQTGAVLVLEAGCAAQALAGAAGLVAGHSVTEAVVLCAYLFASVAILPLTWPLAADDSSPWGGATLAIGAAAIAVVSIRAISIWQG